MSSSSAIDIEVIQKLETGRYTNPFHSELKALATALGTSAAAILWEVEEIPN